MSVSNIEYNFQVYQYTQKELNLNNLKNIFKINYQFTNEMKLIYRVFNFEGKKNLFINCKSIDLKVGLFSNSKDKLIDFYLVNLISLWMRVLQTDALGEQNSIRAYKI